MARALGVLLALAAAAPAADVPADAVRAVERHLRQVIDAAEPSVVAVVVSHKKYPLPFAGDPATGALGGYSPPEPPQRFGGRRFFPPAPPQDRSLDLSDPDNIPDHQYGSGVVLDAGGLVLTNYHLIEGATKVYVRGPSGRGSYANVHAADARSDLAVLKLIDAVPGLRAARVGDVRTNPGAGGEPPTVTRGMWVVAMGHPLAAGFADGSPSASWGILSNVRRRAAGGGREEHRSRALHHYGTLLQTDARVTLGCSGGAILNMDGELIGLSTPLAAVTGAESGGGFAVPFDRNYRRIVDALKQGREVEYGFLGVSVAPGDRTDGGLPLLSVTPGTPAADAGIVQGDRIVAVDGNPVREPDDLFLHVGAALAGTKTAVTVARLQPGGRVQRVTLEATLAKFHHTMPFLASQPAAAVHGLRADWTSVLLLKDGVPNQGVPEGVLVREVVSGSAAEKKLRPLGDVAGRWVVTRVNDRPVRTPKEFVDVATRNATVALTLSDPQANPPAETTITLP